MTPTSFLTLNEVLDIHRDQIARYGGSPRIHDLGMLQSAIAQPAASFGGRYLHADLLEMAAAYLYHLVQIHPFVDGNKRVGAVAAIVFLLLNDHEVNVTDEELESLVLAVAQGQADKASVAQFFRDHAN